MEKVHGQKVVVSNHVSEKSVVPPFADVVCPLAAVVIRSAIMFWASTTVGKHFCVN